MSTSIGGDVSPAPGAPERVSAMVGGSVILDARVPGIVSFVSVEIAVAKMQMQFLSFGLARKVIEKWSDLHQKLEQSCRSPENIQMGTVVGVVECTEEAEW